MMRPSTETGEGVYLVRVDCWYEGRVRNTRNVIHALIEADGIRAIDAVALEYAENHARPDKKLVKLVFRSAARVTFPQLLPFKISWASDLMRGWSAWTASSTSSRSRR